MPAADIQRTLDYADAVAGWLLDHAEERIEALDLEAAMYFSHSAACILSRQNRNLRSVRIESILQRIARSLPDPDPARAGSPLGTRKACLHVLTEALPAGGLTAMARRWIENDDSGRKHSVVLLSQSVPVPEALQEASARTGGRIHLASPSCTMVDTAAWLRSLARAEADHVVLHVDVSDVVSPVAFGIDGGPPVMIVNHSAHVFWTGASTADLVLNCRASALEDIWANVFRGLARVGKLPIPLVGRSDANLGRSDRARQARARAELDIPADAVVMLTVGARFKFLPVNGLDFVDTCCTILEGLPQAVLIGVGFVPDARWLDAAARVQGRIRVLGVIDDAALAAVHELSDVYLEGFPFGTTTALLEAGLSGMPVVLAPAACPPPYGSDGIALDDILSRPASVADFIRQALDLCRNSRQREREGARVRDSISKHHSSPGWNAHLEDSLRMLPATHSVSTPCASEPTPRGTHEYWTSFVQQCGTGYSMTLETAIGNALLAGYRVRLTPGIIRASDEAGAASGSRVPMPVLRMLCNRVLPWVSLPVACRLFRAIAFACRPALIPRILSRISFLSGKAPLRTVWYEEYRQQRQ